MPVAGGGSSAVLNRSLRWAVSLKQRMIQRCGVTTRCEIEALSEPVKPNPVDRSGDVHRLPDHAAVGDDDHDLVGMGGGDALDAAPHAASEVVVGLGARDDVPAPGLEHRGRERILIDDPAAQFATLPLAEEHLTKVGLDLRLDAESRRQRRRRLLRAPQRGHVDGGDPLAGRDQPIRHARRLLVTLRMPAPGRRARR